MSERVSLKGVSTALVYGSPLPDWKPQFTIGKPWLFFRLAWWRFAFVVVPFDLENVLAELARERYDTPTEAPINDA